MRPPSREEVREAQRHLVLLKAQLRTQRLQQSWGRGKQEEHAFASNGGPGRPREVAKTRGSVDQSPRGSVGGMTWDPPSAVQEDGSASGPARSTAPAARSTASRRPAPVEDGYPSSGGPSERPNDKWAPAPNSAASRAGPPSSKPAAPAYGGSGAAQSGFSSQNAAQVGATQMSEFPDGTDAGVPEEYSNSGPLVPCPDCGRQFREDVLEKHIKICKKVFMEKRKKFNSAANRLGDLDNAEELIANAKKLEREKERSERAASVAASSKPNKAGTGESVPKWKMQSLAFRQAILNAKADAGDVEAGEQAAEIQQTLNRAGVTADTGLTKCPHCGRTFNDEAAKRHILICVKTFGSKPGGGRLVKGSGISAANNAKAPKAGSPPATPTGQFAGDMSARGPTHQSDAGNRNASSGPGSRRQAPAAPSLGRPQRGGPSYR